MSTRGKEGRGDCQDSPVLQSLVLGTSLSLIHESLAMNLQIRLLSDFEAFYMTVKRGIPFCCLIWEPLLSSALPKNELSCLIGTFPVMAVVSLGFLCKILPLVLGGYL